MHVFEKEGYITVPYFKDRCGKKIMYKGKAIFIPDSGEWVMEMDESECHIYVNSKCLYKGVFLLRILRDISQGINEDIGRVFFHCSGAVIENNGVLVMGEKGRGKTSLLLAMLSEKASILANDRAFVDLGDSSCDIQAYGFPQAIRVGMGSYNACEKLVSYFKEHSFYREDAPLGSYDLDDKYLISLREICNCFNVQYQQNGSLKLILVPNIQIGSKEFKIQELSKDEKRVLLDKVCFTPDDESFSYTWVYMPKTNVDMKVYNAQKIKDFIIRNIPMIGFTFGTECKTYELFAEIKKYIHI